MHINIASLGKHIDELRSFLNALEHKFDIISVTETKLHNIKPIANIDIDGYSFEHTPTTEVCGGAGLYIRNSLDYFVIPELSKSLNGVGDSLCIQVTSLTKKVIIGSVYRHHKENINEFTDSLLTKILDHVDKNNAQAILSGDFNANLLNLENNNEISNFFDTFSAKLFRPLILQPTRVTARTATLIDNIFSNDPSLKSHGGNISVSISDHLPQFCFLDTFKKSSIKREQIRARSFKNFNRKLFRSELDAIPWEELYVGKTAEEKFKIFFDKNEELLNKMAPIKVLTRKEANLKLNPWITGGILKSMARRDLLHSKYVKEKNPENKKKLYADYKIVRNRVLNILKISKKLYYEKIFKDSQDNVKETWQHIKSVVNINKKKHLLPSSFEDNNGKSYSNKKDISHKFNSMFTDMGPKIDEKSLIQIKTH